MGKLANLVLGAFATLLIAVGIAAQTGTVQLPHGRDSPAGAKTLTAAPQQTERPQTTTVAAAAPAAAPAPAASTRGDEEGDEEGDDDGD